MDTKNFDNVVKTMFDAAQEEVSSRVWDGVQNAMAAAKARRARIIFFRRTAIAASVAAAALLLVLWTGLFSSTETNSTQPYISEAINLVPDNSPAGVEPADGDSGQEGLPIAANALPARTAQATRTARPAKAGNAASTASSNELREQEAEQPAEVGNSDAAVVEPSKPATPKVSIQEAPAEQGGTEVTLEQLMAEDLLASNNTGKGNPTISFGGNLQSNGISTSQFVPTRRRAGVSIPTESTVKENGDNTYALPLSFGIGVNFPIVKRLSLGTGLFCTELRRNFMGQYYQVYDDGEYDIYYGNVHNTVRYLGIPVNLYYTCLEGDLISMYVYGGGAVERALTNKFRIENSPEDINFDGKIHGLQYSVGVGFGIQFKFTNTLSLYLDPSVRYYFDSDQPKTIRTQQPWMLSLELGLRFNL